jgi:hypothetical protein
VPAFGASSGSGGSGGSRGGNAAPSRALPPMPAPLAISGATPKKLEQASQCMKDHGVSPPAPGQGSGTTPPKPPSPSEFRDAAKACGLPAPPSGALPPPLMAAPGAAGKLDGAAVQRCLHAQAKR